MITIESNAKSFIASLQKVPEVVTRVSSTVLASTVSKRAELSFDSVEASAYVDKNTAGISLSGSDLEMRFENGTLPDLEAQMQTIKNQIITETIQGIKEALK